jgi:hypothetical protein
VVHLQEPRRGVSRGGKEAGTTVSELFSQLDIIFGGSPAFQCVAPVLIEEDKEGNFHETINLDHLEPYQPVRGHGLFRRCHSPAKTTVLGQKREARSATGPCCRQYRRDQRPGCIGQICIVELVDIVFNSHQTTIICTRKRLFKHPLKSETGGGLRTGQARVSGLIVGSNAVVGSDTGR